MIIFLLFLVHLIFHAKNNGTGDFKFLETQIIQNDGKATNLDHDKINQSIFVKKLEEQINNPLENLIDDTPPDTLEIDLFESYVFLNTNSMMVFNATDVDSGIKKYELKTNNQWHEVKNPLSISRGLFPREINIKAYDFSNNFIEKKIIIPSLISSNLILSIVLLLFLIIIIRIILKKRRNKSNNQ